MLKYSARFSSNNNHDVNEASLVVGEVTSGGDGVRDVGVARHVLLEAATDDPGDQDIGVKF